MWSLPMMLVGDTCNLFPSVARLGPQISADARCITVSACSVVGASGAGGASLLCRVYGLEASRRRSSLMCSAAPNVEEQVGCLFGESGSSGMTGPFGKRCPAGLATGADASRLVVKTVNLSANQMAAQRGTPRAASRALKLRRAP